MAAPPPSASEVDDAYLPATIRNLLTTDAKGKELLAFFLTERKADSPQTPEKSEITHHLKQILEHVRAVGGKDNQQVKTALSDWTRHCKTDYAGTYRGIRKLLQTTSVVVVATENAVAAHDEPQPPAPLDKTAGPADDSSAAAEPVAVAPPAKSKSSIFSAITGMFSSKKDAGLVDAPVDYDDVPNNPMELLGSLEATSTRGKKRFIDTSEVDLDVIGGGGGGGYSPAPPSSHIYGNGDEDSQEENPLQQLLALNDKLVASSAAARKAAAAAAERPTKRQAPSTGGAAKREPIVAGDYEASEARADLQILGISSGHLPMHQQRRTRVVAKT